MSDKATVVLLPLGFLLKWHPTPRNVGQRPSHQVAGIRQVKFDTGAVGSSQDSDTDALGKDV